MDGKTEIKALEEFCRKNGLTIAVLYGYDGKQLWVTTWGDSPSDSDHAAKAGNRLKDVLEWPEQCKMKSPKVEKLEKTIEFQEKRIKDLEEKLDKCIKTRKVAYHPKFLKAMYFYDW